MSLNMTAELLTKLWQRNGSRWIHRAPYTGQYNKSEHCTRKQSTDARYACFNSWYMQYSLIKNEKQQTGVEPAPRRVPGSLHTQLLCRQTHTSSNESCQHVMGVGKQCLFPQGLGYGVGLTTCDVTGSRWSCLLLIVALWCLLHSRRNG